MGRNGRYKRIHFLSDVLVALASLDLKVPNRRDTRIQDNANFSLLILSLHTVNRPSCNARPNVLDSTPWILDSRYWIPDSINSLAVELGFRTPVISGIPDSLSWIMDPGFWITLHGRRDCWKNLLVWLVSENIQRRASKWEGTKTDRIKNKFILKNVNKNTRKVVVISFFHALLGSK